MPNRPQKFSYIGRGNKKINLSSAFTGGIGSGITGGVNYTPDTAVQPNDESTLEQGTTDNLSTGGRFNYQPYTVNHPILDALFNQGRGSMMASQYNDAMGIREMQNQDALDRINLENELATKRQQASEDSRYNDEIALRDDAEDRKNKSVDDDTVRTGQALQMAEQDARTRNLGLEPSYTARTLGMVAPVLYGRNLETSGLPTAQNINTAAYASRELLPALTKARQGADIAKLNLSTTQDTGTNDYITQHPNEFNSSVGAELAKQKIANTHTQAVADALNDKSGKLVNLGTHKPNDNTMVTSLLDPETKIITNYETGLDNQTYQPTFNVRRFDASTGLEIVPKQRQVQGPPNSLAPNNTDTVIKKKKKNTDSGIIPSYTGSQDTPTVITTY